VQPLSFLQLQGPLGPSFTLCILERRDMRPHYIRNCHLKIFGVGSLQNGVNGSWVILKSPKSLFEWWLLCVLAAISGL
jgi:hypothetical protein